MNALKQLYDTILPRVFRQITPFILGLILLAIAGTSVHTSQAQSVQATYYLPYRSDNVYNSLNTLYTSACGTSPVPTNPIASYNSISVVFSGTILYYDHWEDGGYEADPLNPVQTASEVWGDGNLTNGVAPGHPNDLLDPGDILVLEDVVNTGSIGSTTYFDGRDKISSSKYIAVTRGSWASGSNTLLAGAWEVFSTDQWGTRYLLPIGEDVSSDQVWEYVGGSVMASEDSTQVYLNGVLVATLDEGEEYYRDGGFNAGDELTASAPVQFHLITGNICANYESRWFTLPPVEDWASSYVNPVSTFAGDGTEVWFYYEGPASSITVTQTISGGSTTNITVFRGVPRSAVVPDNTAQRFESTGGEPFYALVAVDADGTNGNNTTHDWGYSILPETSLTNYVVAGWAPGDDPTYTGSAPENSAPLWLTAIYPQGSTGSGPITICIDYLGDGDNGLTTGGTDPVSGLQYDRQVTLNELERIKIYTDLNEDGLGDVGADQTGTKVWVCDGSDVLLAMAYGQDPNTAVGGRPAIDVGTGSLALPTLEIEKTSVIVGDNGNGVLDVGEILRYSIVVTNNGVAPLTSGSITVTDNLPSALNYVLNSSFVDDGTVTAVADDVSGSPFPFDTNGSTGYIYPSALNPGSSFSLTADTTVSFIPVSKSITNEACASSLSNSACNSDTRPTADVGTIGQYVWYDLDGDGIKDPGEPGIPGVDVTVTLPGGGTQTVTTGADGFYSFTAPEAGTYTVTVDTADLPSGLTQTFDPDGTAPGNVANVTITTVGDSDSTINFGYQPNGSLSGTLYEDIDQSGSGAGTDPPFSGVTVALFKADGVTPVTDSSGNPLTSVTDANGNYSFSNLFGADYVVRVEGLELYANLEEPDDPSGGDDRQALVTVAPGATVTDQDFGFYLNPAGDLTFTKAVTTTQAEPGDTFTYTLLPSWGGSELLSNVTVTDALPSGTLYAGSSPTATSAPSIGATSGTVTWNLGSNTAPAGFSLLGGQDPFGTLENVSNGLGGQDSLDPGVVAFDDDGVAHIVFEGKATGASRRNVYYTNNSSGSWSTPVLLSDDTDGQDGLDPAIAVDSNGDVHILYTDKQSGDAKRNAYYVKVSGGAVVLGPTAISSDVNDARQVDIAIDASDTLHVAYIDKFGSDGKLNVYYQYCTISGGLFSFPERLSNDADGQDALETAIAVSPSGTVAVVYTDKPDTNKRNTYIRIGTAGAFDPEIQLSDDEDGQDSVQPDVAMDDDGVAHATWVDTGTNSNANIYYANSGNWGGTLTTLSDDSDGQDALEPTVAVDNFGFVHVAFRDKSADSGTAKINIYYTNDRSGSFGALTNLTLDLNGGDSFTPELTTNVDGVHLALQADGPSKADIFYTFAAIDPSLKAVMAATPTLVTDGATITVSLTLSATSDITNVSPGALPSTVTGTNGVVATLVGGQPASQTVPSNVPTTFTWTYTADTTAATAPGQLTFSTTASGDGAVNWGASTSSSVIATPPLTFDVTAADPPTADVAENRAFIVDSSGTINSTPSNRTVTSLIQLMLISGQVRDDIDGNGNPGDPDSGIDGVTVTLYSDPDGNGDPSDGVALETAVTAGGGLYSFVDYPEGDYVIVETNLPGFSSTYDPDGDATDDAIAIGLVGGVDSTSNDFLDTTNVDLGSIGDTIFWDKDGNGVPDLGEGLQGVLVYVDENGNGQYDFGEPSATTDGVGNYTIYNVPPGSHTVNVDTTTLPGGFTNTTDPDGGGDSTAQVTLVPGENNVTTDFGYSGSGTIGDTIFLDTVSTNGVPDAGEGIANVVVYVDENGNGIRDPGELHAITDANGTYTLTGLPAGTFEVRVDSASLDSALINVADPDGTLDGSTVVPLAAGENVVTADWGYLPGSTISGTIYSDEDGLGSQDSGEPGIVSVLVGLYESDGVTPVLDAQGNPLTTITDNDGNYAFEDLTPGDYVIVVDPSFNTLPALASNLEEPDDPNGGNDSRTAVTVTLGTDVTNQDFGYVVPNNIDKLVSPTSPIAPGGTLSYTIGGIQYGGSELLSGVEVSDVIPDGTTYVGDSDTPEATLSEPADGGTGTLTWNLGSNVTGTGGTAPGIVLCPEFITQTTVTTAQSGDTFLDQGNPDTNEGDLNRIKIDSRAGTLAHGLVKFDLTGIPDTAIIDSVSLGLDLQTAKDSTTTLYQMTTPWVEGDGTAGSGATWNSSDGSSSWAVGAFGVGDYANGSPLGSLNNNQATNTFYEVADTAGAPGRGLTDVVQDWVNGTATNEGLLLFAGGIQDGDAQYYSANEGDATRHPYLVVTFRTPQTTPCNVTARDEFTRLSYNNNDGLTAWAGDWVENPDYEEPDNDPAGGRFMVVDGAGAAGYLRFRSEQDDPADGQNIYRSVNLGGASAASLTYNLLDNGFDGGETFVVEASNNGGGSYAVLETIDETTVLGVRSFDLIGALGSVGTDTRIRFRQVAANGDNKELNFDDIEIAWTLPVGAGGSSSLGASPTLVADGDSITVSMTVTSAEEINNITPGTPVFANAAGGASATSITAVDAGPKSIPPGGGSVTFLWTATAQAGTSLPSSLAFSAQAVGTDQYGNASDFSVATSNSVLIAPDLTFQVTVDDPAALEAVENQAMLVDTTVLAAGLPSQLVISPIDQALDYGDLPTQTLAADDGARHLISGVYLGTTAPDAEADGQPTSDATGDGADEDGVVFGTLTPGATGTLTVTASGSGVLNGWADWNGDGVFTANERILIDTAVAGGVNTLNINVPPGAVIGDTAFRFRITDAAGEGGDSPTGFASSGEVEDYYAPVTPPPATTSGHLYADLNGNGQQDPGEPDLANVDVVVTDGNGTQTVQTNSNGDWTATVEPGSVTANVDETDPEFTAAFPNGFVQTEGEDPSTVTAVSGSDIDAGTDGYFNPTGGTSEITGQVRLDGNGNGVLTDPEPGIAGVGIALYLDTDGNGIYDGTEPLVTETTTGSDGTYSFSGLPDANYLVVETNSPGATSTGDKDGNSPLANTLDVIAVDLTGGGSSVDNDFLDAGVLLADIGGFVFDDNDTSNDDTFGADDGPVSGVTVNLYRDENGDGLVDAGDTLLNTVATGTGGAYLFANLPNGNYVVEEIDPSGAASEADTDGPLTDNNIGVVLAGTDSLGNNFLDDGTVTGTITGIVYEDDTTPGFSAGDVPVTGVTLSLYTDPNGDGDPSDGVLVDTTSTLSDGSYSFPNVIDGNYVVVENDPFGSTSVADVDGDPLDNEVGVTLTGGTQDIASADFLDTNVDQRTISGTVFDDTGADGSSASDSGLAGATVQLWTDLNGDGDPSDGTLVATAPVTTASGTFTFTGLAPGTYVLIETDPATYSSTADVATSSALNTNTNDNQIPVDVFAADSTGNEFLDTTTPIFGTVFEDTNGNGVQDPGEAGLPGVDVLITPNGGAPFTVTTGSGGHWNASVPSGLTTADVVEATLPAGLTLSTIGSDPTTITVLSGVPTDFGKDGYEPAAGVYGHVFEDTNGDGNQDPGEPNLPGVDVLITPSTGSAFTVTTGPDGNWSTNVPAGSTTADVDETTLPAGVTQTAGTDPTTLNVLSGSTTNMGDDGYQPSASAYGHVFLDTNGDGSQDPGEPNLPGVDVLITPSTGPAFTVTTGPDGNWSASVPAGSTTADVDETTLPAGVTQTAGSDPTTLNVPVGSNTHLGDDGYQPAATVYGHVFEDTNGNGIQDPGEPNLPGVDVVITDSNGNPQTVTTDPSGNWTASVPTGSTTVDVDESTLPPGVTQTAGIDPQTVIVAAGANDLGIDGYQPAASVYGHVFEDTNGNGSQDPGEPNLPGVDVILTDSSGNPVTVTTDADGNWSSPVTPGDVLVDVDEATLPPGVTQTAGTDPDTVNVPASSNTNGGDDGYQPAATVYGHVFEDTNGNGSQDPGEPNLPGVDVVITDSNGNPQTVTTDPSGNWTASVPTGSTIVDVDESTLPPGVTQTAGTDPETVTVVAGPNDLGIDGYQPAASVYGHVFEDTNGNGSQDPGEPNLPGVDVILTDSSGNPVTVTTDADGNWSSPVTPGDVLVDVDEATLPPGVTQTAGTDPDTVNVPASSNTNGGDDGYQPAATVYGHVFEDTNGNGSQDPGEPNLPGVDVVITDSNGNPQTVTTDPSGNWTASVPTGSTIVDVDESTLPPGVTQTAGTDPETVTVVAGPNDLGIDGYQPAASIYGHVFEDTNGDGDQDSGEPNLPGVDVVLTDSSGNPVTVTTDTNGNWSSPVTPGNVIVDVDEATLPPGVTQTAGTDPDTVNVPADSNTNGGDDGYQPAATVYGHVFEDTNGNGSQDPGEPNLPGVDVVITDSNGNPQTVTTDPSGNWTASVPTGLTTVDVDESTLPPGVTQTAGTDPETVTVVAGPNDFGIDGYQPAASIYGHVFEDTNGNGSQDPGEPNLPGVDVILTDSSGNPVTVTTDADGNWSSPVTPGDVIVDVDEATLPPGVTQTAGTDPQTVNVPASSNTDGGDDGYQPAATVYGHVFEDTNGNGSQDPGEPNLPGVDVVITDSNGNPQTVTTDPSGNWTASVPTGSTTVDVDESTLPPGVMQTAGTDPQTVTVVPGPNDLGFDGYQPAASVYGRVFEDSNGNGTQDPGEPGYENVSVVITDSSGTPVIVTTDENGDWSTPVHAGSTTINVDETTLPSGVSQTAGTDPNTVTVLAGTATHGLDDGYQPAATAYGHVFEDTNGNGSQDPGEPNLEGVNVVVTDSTGNPVTVTTDENGNWSTPVTPGPVTADVDEGSLPPNVTQTAGTDPTTVTVLAGAVTDLGTDGYQPVASVTGHVFLDSNGNGTQESGEPNLPGVDVEITESNGATQIVTTDANGDWSASVPAGSTTADVQESTLPSGVTQTAGTDPNTVTALAGTSTDAGEDGYQPGATVSGHVFLDTDGSGGQNGSEPDLEGIQIKITDANGIVTVVTTNSNGDWSSPVPIGNATIDVLEESLPPGVTQTAGTDPQVIAIVSGPNDAGEDGYQPAATVSGHIFQDDDGFGTQNGSEPNLSGVQVKITDSTGHETIVTTDSNGDWSSPVPLGNATIDVIESTLPPGMTQTAGTDPQSVTIVSGSNDGGEDGYQPVATVTGLVFADTNGNGSQDLGELGLPGVNVLITDSQGTTQTVTTGPDGTWSANVPAGFTVADVDESTLPLGSVQTAGVDSTSLVALAGITTDMGIDGYQIPVPGKANNFADWQTANPLGGSNGPADNPDGDIWDNALEFALCLDPDSGVPGHPAFCALGQPDGTIDVVFYRPAGGVTGVTYSLEGSAALGSPTSWTTLLADADNPGGATVTVTDQLNGSEEVKIEDVGTLGTVSNQEGYVRLQVAIASPSHTSHTYVFGWNETIIHDEQCHSFGNPFLKKESFSAVIDSISGHDLTLSTSAGGLDLSTVLDLTNASYYVEVISGDLVGHRFDIDSAGVDRLTLAADVNLVAGPPFNTVNSIVPSQPFAGLAGDSIVVREHFTVAETFPPVAPFEAATEYDTVGTDRLLFYGSSGWEILYLKSGTPNTWVNAVGDALEGARILPPCQGYFIHPQHGGAGSSITLLAIGVVRENQTACPLNTGYNLVAPGTPVDGTPNSWNLTTTLSGSLDPVSSDQILLWNGNVINPGDYVESYGGYFILPGNGGSRPSDKWVDVIDVNLTDQGDTSLFKKDRSSFLLRRASGVIDDYFIPAGWAAD